jgi:hypothetical protein
MTFKRWYALDLGSRHSLAIVIAGIGLVWLASNFSTAIARAADFALLGSSGAGAGCSGG